MKIPVITIPNITAWCLPSGFIKRYEEVLSELKTVTEKFNDEI